MNRQRTMKDVAKIAGVTQATVSYVINDTASVSEEVKKRVFKAIDELEYVPNALAKSLKENKTNTIGLIIPDINNGYYAEMVKNVEKDLRIKGYIIYLCNTSYDPNLEFTYIMTLIKQKVAGIIIGYGLVNKSIYNSIQIYKINFVVIDDKVEVKNKLIPCVEIDNIKGSLLAVQHLNSIGAKKICFASEPLFNRALKLRYEGFENAIKKFGYNMEDVQVYVENKEYDKIEMGYNIGSKIILDNVDAVFSSTDNLAFGIIKRLQEYGYRLPDDINIIGYDDVPFCRYISPTLTTISQPVDKMVEEGTKILDNLIKGEEIKKRYQLMEPSLIIRESTMRKTTMRNK